MSSLSETRRASSTAPSAQHASSRSISGMFGRSGHTFKVTPITSWPACLSRAAVTELSTPPDMPTITRAIGGILSEIDLDDFAYFVHGIGFGDAPGADGRVGCVGQADEDVERREVGRQANVGRRRAGLAVSVRVVVADEVEPELVDLVVDAELVARIHVVVHGASARGGHAGGAVAKDAAVGGHLVGRVTDAKDTFYAAVATRQHAADLIRN